MTYLSWTWIPVISFLAFVLVWIVKALCFRFNILDIPNNRSSHHKPTALMGGIGFIFAFCIGFAGEHYISGSISNLSFVGLIIAACVIAIISLIDDVKRLSSGVRFGCHTLAAIFASLMGFKMVTILLPFIPITLGLLIIPVSIVFIVAMTNIYNFMDGIDGYAAGVGVIGSVAFALLAYLNHDFAVMKLCVYLASAIFGFLIWNYPKAKIFMGDVGSAFLGFVFGSLSLYIATTYQISILIPIAIFSVFIVDATVTIIRRALNGERLWEAHRSHFYQRLNISGWSHQRIIWLEYSHMLFCCFLAIGYYFVSQDAIKLVYIALFLMSFIIKFTWISLREKRVL